MNDTPEEAAKAALAAKRAKTIPKYDPPNNIASIRAKLLYVQSRIRVLKNRGKGHTPGAQVTYEYRNAEAILDAVKPLCQEVGAVVTIDVTPLVIGEQSPVDVREVKLAVTNEKGKVTAAPKYARLTGPRFLAVATATFHDCESNESISCRSFAEIDFWRSGQTEPEKLCGSADSYASKYALGHLFALDNNRDADMESDIPTQRQSAWANSQPPPPPPDDF
jgi:hypothetical protein